MRIATGGTDPPQLSPSLVNRTLMMAARISPRFEDVHPALDYCPPVDITFGEYPRHRHRRLRSQPGDQAVTGLQ
jgi:hypothetical protein